MTAFVAGDVIAERYELISLLGEGGMGIVWRARDRRLARTVAVKLLSANVVGTDSARARLIREARAAAALEVDGIIRVYDVDELAEGGAFLVMELIRGKSFRARMMEGLAPARVVKIIAAAARALQAAHDAGVVHRDVKPDNIMLREDDRPIVVDFGIAKPVATEVLETAETLAGITGSSAITGQASIVGTPAYLSPEQARSHDVGPKTDQFALAVTMYEALSGGVSPWTGNTVVEIVASILRDPPLPLPETLPPAFEKVLARAMSKAPEKRYPDMSSFATAVEAAGVGLTDRGLFSPSGTLSLFPRPPTTETRDAAAEDARDHDPAGISTHGAITSKAAVGTSAIVPPSKRPLIFAGIIAAVLVGLVFLMRRGASTDTVATAPSPDAFALGVNGATACPQFEVVGIDAPWLGAAAAALACERVQIARGGLDKSTLTPAELAGVPREIAPNLPAHIYDGAKSRDSALAASKDRAARYLDGKLEKGTETYTATIVLRSAKGEELVRGEKAGVEIFEAVRGAMEPILARRAPLTEEESKHLQDWLDVDSVDHALALLDVRTSIMIEDPILVRSTCKAYEDRAERERQPARVSYFAKAACKKKLRTDNDLGTPPEIDESTPGALMTSSLALGTMGGGAIVRERAAKLEAARSKEGIAPEDRARLLAVAAELYNLISDDRAGDVSRLAIIASPKATDWRASSWHRVAFSSNGDSSLGATLTAWQPWEPVSQSQWGSRQPRVQSDGGLNQAYGDSVMRSYLLSRRGPYAQGYGTELLGSGDVEAARGVAEIAEDPVIKIEIMVADASYGAVLKKVPDLLRELPRNDENAALAYRLSYQGVRAALILDRPADWMEDVVNGYVLSEPHHVIDGAIPVVSLIHACLFAPKPVAKKCIDRIEQLRKDGKLPTIFATLETVIGGGVKFVEEDYVGATKIWRTLLRSVGWVQGPLREPLAIAFEKAGESDLAEEVDSPIVALVDLPRTADPSWVRAAKRAYKKGDIERARHLASAVVDKWRFADESPKGVGEMKELLGKLPHPPN